MSEQRKNRQIMIAFMGVIGVVGSFYFVSQLTKSDTASFSRGQDPGLTTTMIAGRTDGASPEMSWITSGRENIEDLQQTVKDLSQSLEIISNKAADEIAALTVGYDEQIIAQQAEINALKELIAQSGGARPADTPSSVGQGGDFLMPASAVAPRGGTPNLIGDQRRSGLNALDPNAGNSTPASQSTVVPQAAAPSDFARTFALTPIALTEEEEAASNITQLENYLPAGSYAPAVVLSGVDASTGVSSQGDPIPVLFRITGAAVTAGTRSTRGHRVDLTGCTVTGSARGDLSSERVYVRLLKLACIKPGQQVFETDVAGYMSGSGKTGARGLVTSREGNLVSAAAVAGALGGLAGAAGNIGSQASGSEAASLDDALLGAGVGTLTGGLQSAADKLSSYYIERAEQYQPVVSLYGGTEVEVVFMEGVSLD